MMTKPFKPLLAYTLEGEPDFPVLASMKIDGIRCIVRDGVAMSRSLKPIRNQYVQSILSPFEGLDGELVVGDPNADDVYKKTFSGVMKAEGKPDFVFWVFDDVTLAEKPFETRLMRTWDKVADLDCVHVKFLPHTILHSMEQLDRFESEALSKGFEGVMLRNPDAPLRNGRSTPRDGSLAKCKRFQIEEFEVVGTVERMKNNNEAVINELGYTERSTHKENKVGHGDLGALVLRHGDTTFNCGTGFNLEERAALWADRDNLIGKLVRVKYFAIGDYDVPRFPVWVGFRDLDDL